MLELKKKVICFRDEVLGRFLGVVVWVIYYFMFWEGLF